MQHGSEGLVLLVGAGPGDPGLLTLKALEAICGADVVVYDRLVSAGVLARIPAGVSRIFVGKAPGRHQLPQAEINALLVRLGRAGRRVVRLKGGDPFIFGRGAEEALALQAAGVRFEVIPGITAATAAAASVAIPLTHRGLARGVQFVAGHCQEDLPLALDWAALADPEVTLAVYMGLANLDALQTGLLGAGRDPNTPVALIEAATTARERLTLTSLSGMVATARRVALAAPCLIVIGAVVELAEVLGRGAQCPPSAPVVAQRPDTAPVAAAALQAVVI